MNKIENALDKKRVCMSNKLNLGCGGFKKVGFVNVDWQPLVKPDVLHDLNNFPYPFEDNMFDVVEANHVLEHMDKVFLVMKEIHRILRPGGRLLLKVPHFSRGFTHAEHSHGFDVTFPLYFNRNFAKSGFFGVEFKLEKTKLRWIAFFNLMPSLGYSRITISLLSILNIIISFLANLSPNFCSRFWCYLVGGFEEIEFNFICLK